MRIEDTFEVPAPPAAVWHILKDVPRVTACIPGAELKQIVDERNFDATVTVRIGPVELQYDARIAITGLDDAAREASLTITGSDTFGRGAIQATVVSKVMPTDGGSRVEIAADADLAGMAASLGAGLIKAVAKRTIATFANNVARACDSV